MEKREAYEYLRSSWNSDPSPLPPPDNFFYFGCDWINRFIEDKCVKKEIHNRAVFGDEANEGNEGGVKKHFCSWCHMHDGLVVVIFVFLEPNQSQSMDSDLDSDLDSDSDSESDSESDSLSLSFECDAGHSFFVVNANVDMKEDERDYLLESENENSNSQNSENLSNSSSSSMFVRETLSVFVAFTIYRSNCSGLHDQISISSVSTSNTVAF